MILLSRVVVKLGRVSQVTPKTVEALFTEDLAFLQSFFNEINGMGPRKIDARCPRCSGEMTAERRPLGESVATPWISSIGR